MPVVHVTTYTNKISVTVITWQYILVLKYIKDLYLWKNLCFSLYCSRSITFPLYSISGSTTDKSSTASSPYENMKMEIFYIIVCD